MPESRRLILLVSVLLVAGFLATSLASYFVSKSAVRDSIVTHLLPLSADNIYSEIQRDLLRPILISSVMAQDTWLRDWAIGGERDAKAMTKYLDEIMRKYGTFTAFFVSERTRTYYHAKGILKSVRASEPRDAWFFRVREMKEDYEINVDPDMANRDTMTIFINYRVYDYHGKFIGVTGVGLTVDAVRKLVDDYERRYRRNVFFVDSEGTLVLTGISTSLAFHSIREEAGYSGIAEAVLASDRGSFQYRRGGDTVLVNTRYIPELKWYLFVEQAEDPSLEGLRKTLYGNLAVCLLITAVVLLATSYTMNYYQARVDKMATTDKLTGALNRQAFDIVFQQALKDAQRTKAPMSAILFDLDQFKAINDTYGHLAGDRVLEAVTKGVQEVLRKADVICRWGGEEFLVLLRDCPGGQAFILAEKIREVVIVTKVEEGGGHIPLAVSLGVAERRPEEPLDRLIYRADEALFTAKREGRNRSVMAK